MSIIIFKDATLDSIFYMYKLLFAALLFFIQCFQLTASGQISEKIPAVGGISFAGDGSLLRFNISGGGQDIAVKNDVPWSLITGSGNSKKSFKVNRISLVLAQGQSVSLELSSTDLPDSSAMVELTSDEQSIKATVKRVSGQLITGISVQFQMPEDFDCQVGFPPFFSAHHSCSNARGTVAAFCITGNCDNTVQYDSAFIPRFGATLSQTPIQELSGSSFVIFTVPHNHKTLAFLKDFSSFRQKFGNTAEMSSSLFFTSLPKANDVNCADKFLCPERVQSAAKLARSLGFEETILLSDIWLKTTGEFDPRPNLAEAIKEFKKNGVCPVLHTIASELHPYNSLCTPDAGDKPGLGGANYRCPTKAAKAAATGQQFINAYGSFYLWDGNQRQVFDRVVKSYVNGLKDSGACGLYADGADWFGDVHPQLGQIYLAEMSRNAPNLRLRAAIFGSPNALHVRDVDGTDNWQIRGSRTPKDWIFNWGYFNLQGWREHFGISGRLGWLPPPRDEDTPENYLPMFNAAVANGSFVTIETPGDDASLTTPKFAWFRDALRETVAAVKEIRGGGSEGTAVIRTARYDLTNFGSGVSTIALFDSIIPAAAGSKLDARSYGVKMDKGNVCRNENAGCFYFKGTPRLPVSPTSPPLSDGGSFIYSPGDISTRSKNFTLATWIKPEQPNSNGGVFEKGNLGYGLFLWNGQIGGHTTGKTVGNFYNNPYFILENPQSWNHFIYSFNDRDRRLKCYLNGKLVLDQSLINAPSPRISADSPIFVGSAGDPFANFRGWLDGVMLYDRAIGDDEASALFNGNPTVGNPVISWSAGNSSPPKTLDINLETQRIVYLVPMLEGVKLPPEQIRLTFTGFRGKASSAKIQTSVKFRRLRSDSNTLVIEIDSKNLGDRPSRIAVKP